MNENWLALSKMAWRTWQIFVHRLKNSDFIVESKKAELNQNKNSKQPDRPDAVRKLDFTFKINEKQNQRNFLHMFYDSLDWDF